VSLLLTFFYLVEPSCPASVSTPMTFSLHSQGGIFRLPMVGFHFVSVFFVFSPLSTLSHASVPKQQLQALCRFGASAPASLCGSCRVVFTCRDLGRSLISLSLLCYRCSIIVPDMMRVYERSPLGGVPHDSTSIVSFCGVFSPTLFSLPPSY
jgi:hypothetical protein